MALYQNFTGSIGTLNIPGPIIGSHDNNTLGNIFTTGGNIGMGTSAPLGRLHITLPANVDSSWRDLVYRGTSFWGDGITTFNAAGVYTSGTLYGTLMTPMLYNPHVTSVSGDTARIRYGRAGGIASGAWWETGVKTDGSWHIGQSGVTNNFIITTGGNVGVNTGTPSYRLDVVGNIRSTDDIFIGNGSTAEGITLWDVPGAAWKLTSGSWNLSIQNGTGGSTMNTRVTITSIGNVGIGTATPSQKLHVVGSIKASESGVFGTNSLFSIEDQTTFTRLAANEIRIWDHNYGDILYVNNPGIGIYKSPSYALDINGSRLNLHNAAGTGGGQNLFEGLENISQRCQIVLSSSYSDLVIASSQANENHGSTLTFASYNPSNKADHRKWVINQGNWGSRVHMLEFGYNPNNIANPHDAINDTYTTMTLDGVNDRVGIGNRGPSFKLDVNGDFRAYGGRYIIQNSQDGGTGRGIYMWTEADNNWAIYMGQSGAGKSLSGGTATTGVYGFAAHAVRFRVYNNPANPSHGWIFENGSEGHVASIRSDGHAYFAGNVGIGTVSPSYKLHVNGDTLTNGWFRTTGDTGLWSDTYSRGMRVAVSGDYGNIETHGAGKNNWEGFSIDGRYVFMGDNNECGIYNDVDNNWIMYFNRNDTNNRYAQLRHNDNGRLWTTSSGIYVSSRVTVDAGSGTAGYYFGENPGGGGGGDAAWIKYYARSGEACNLEIGTSNDGDDHIYLNPAGGVGIGTNGPAAKLDVANGGQTMAIIRGNNAGTNAYQSDWPGGWDGGLATRDITVTSIYYSGLSQRSDIRKKTNIETYTRGLTELLQLRPVTFNWKPEFYYNPEETQFGFIAQEVEPIIPEIVGEDSQGYKYIKNAHTPLLVNSIKELNNKFEEEKQAHLQTKQELENVKSQLNQLFEHLGITPN